MPDLKSTATRVGTTTLPVQRCTRTLISSGIVGRLPHSPGTRIVGMSRASAKTLTRPRTKFGRWGEGVAPMVIHRICGAVVSWKGPRWPGASGLTTWPFRISVRWTCISGLRIGPSTVVYAETDCPTWTLGWMCQYSNARPPSESTRTHSVETRVTVPDRTG